MVRKGNVTQLEFRIIAGSLKGKQVVLPDLGVTRPPLSRLRKSIFDYLNPFLDEARYLDLFSGTGSYLFEAVSRGARSATGVELARQLCDGINDHAGRFGVSDRLRCLNDDVLVAVPNLSASGLEFEIIMMAPPQYKGIIDRTLAILAAHRVLAADGQILCQHDTSETDKIDWGKFEIRQRRKYGNTTFTILNPAAAK